MIYCNGLSVPINKKFLSLTHHFNFKSQKEGKKISIFSVITPNALP